MQIAHIYSFTACHLGVQRAVLLSFRRSRKRKNGKCRTLKCIYIRDCQILSTFCSPSSFPILSFLRLPTPQLRPCLLWFPINLLLIGVQGSILGRSHFQVRTPRRATPSKAGSKDMGSRMYNMEDHEITLARMHAYIHPDSSCTSLH